MPSALKPGMHYYEYVNPEIFGIQLYGHPNMDGWSNCIARWAALPARTNDIDSDDDDDDDDDDDGGGGGDDDGGDDGGGDGGGDGCGGSGGGGGGDDDDNDDDDDMNVLASLIQSGTLSSSIFVCFRLVTVSTMMA